MGGREEGWSSCLCVQVYVMNVAAAVLFDVPPSWLTYCGQVKLVVDTAQHHTVDLMFADSLSHCWYSKPWVVSEGKEESLRKSQNRDLHLVALCVPLSVWSLKCHLGIRHMKIKAE